MLRIFGQLFSIYLDDISHFLGYGLHVPPSQVQQNFSIMLFTKLYLGVNGLIFLLPVVIPPSLQIGKTFCKHHGLYIPFVNFSHQLNCLLLQKKKKKRKEVFAL